MKMIFSVSPEGVTFLLKVHPGGKADRLTGIHAGMLKVEVRAAPEKGKANKAVIKLLAELLQIPERGLSIVSGEKSARKKVLAESITEAELARRIACILERKE